MAVNFVGAKMRSTGTWMSRVSRDERLMAAELAIFAYTACEDDLIRLAVSLDLKVPWGETVPSLRSRIVWRGRWYYRLKKPFVAPDPVLTTWGKLVNNLPTNWQPIARKIVDRFRARSRALEP